MLGKENASQSELGQEEIVPNNREIEIWRIDSKQEGEHALNDLSGEVISGISMLRLESQDFIVLNTVGKKQVFVVGNKDSIIAVKLNDRNGQSGSIAFREDISPKRFNLVESAIKGQDVTYQDKSASEETTELTLSAKLSQLILKERAIIKGISPSWWTEDWLTVRLDEGRSIVIRFDAHNLFGIIVVDSSKIKVVNIRENRIQNIDFSKLSDL